MSGILPQGYWLAYPWIQFNLIRLIRMNILGRCMSRNKNSAMCFKLIIIPIIFMIFSAACLSSSRLMTMNISESRLNLLLGNPVIPMPDANGSFSVSNLDIREDMIRVQGEFLDEESDSYAGYFDLDLQVEDGKIRAHILQYDFPGAAISEELLLYMEEQIENNLESAASRSWERIKFDEIVFVPDGILIRVRIPLEPTATLR